MAVVISQWPKVALPHYSAVIRRFAFATIDVSPPAPVGDDLGRGIGMRRQTGWSSKIRGKMTGKVENSKRGGGGSGGAAAFVNGA